MTIQLIDYPQQWLFRIFLWFAVGAQSVRLRIYYFLFLLKIILEYKKKYTE